MAISLCKQDIDFANRLTRAINPSLTVFFYEHRQEELIGKSGPEEFAKTFKELSRVVVIISRKEWGESVYTEIERNAIVDGFTRRGYNHIMVIPMAHGEIPAWYPSNRIYVDPLRFTVEEIARFIEFKVAEEGGSVKQLTVEDHYRHLLKGIEEKKTLVALQEEPEAIKCARSEVFKLKDCFKQKCDFLRITIVNSVQEYQFSENINNAFFGYGEFLLECRIQFPLLLQTSFSTQNFAVSFSLFKTFEGDTKKLVEAETRIFYYTPSFHGWAIRNLYESPTNKELLVLFRDGNSDRYDLIKPVRTELWVDAWFQKLLSLSTQKITRYI